MILYRYRKPNLDFLESEILEDKLYLWKIIDQNDPFEGKYSIHQNANSASLLKDLKRIKSLVENNSIDWKDWLIEPHLKERYLELAKLSDRQLEEFAKNSINQGKYDASGTSLMKNRWERMKNKVLMACFSTKKNDPVMFAHYAENHKGVCLEYDVDLRDFSLVNYIKTYPKINLMGEDPDEIYKCRLLTKYKDWNYESEYRLLKYDQEPGLYNNDRIKLRSVYLGTNATNEFKNRVLSLIRERADIKLYFLELMEDKYEFKELPL